MEDLLIKKLEKAEKDINWRKWENKAVTLTVRKYTYSGHGAGLPNTAEFQFEVCGFDGKDQLTFSVYFSYHLLATRVQAESK